MSKKDEDELGEILKALDNFVEKRGGHALAVITYPSSEEEAKGVPVVCDRVCWVIKGNTALTLELIRRKFAKMFRRFKERDEAIARDIKEREARAKKS